LISWLLKIFADFLQTHKIIMGKLKVERFDSFRQPVRDVG